MKMLNWITLALAATAAVPTFADEPTGYAAHQTVTFSGYSGTTSLANFPALLRLPAQYFNREDKKDLAVTDASGNLLPFEIDAKTDTEVLVWVRVPELSGNNTSITAYFGKDEPDVTDFTVPDVWTNAYAAVWHLNTDATDSTGHGLAQKAYNANHVSEVTAGASLVGRSLALNNNNVAGLLFETPKAEFIDNIIANPSTITVTGWFKPEKAVPSKAMRLFCWKASTGDPGFDTFQNSNGKFYMRGNNKNVSWITAATMQWTVGSWAHLAARFNGTTYAAYLNGAEMVVDSNSNNAKTSAIEIGDGTNVEMLGFGNVGAWNNAGNITVHGDYQYPFANGQLDELRIYNGVASADWIKAEHDTVAGVSFADYGQVIVDGEGEDVDGVWISTAATANWSDAENWQDGVVASGVSPTITFASGAVAQTIVLSGDIHVLALVQNDSATRTITGGSVVFSAAADVTVASGGTLTLDSDIVVPSLVKKGAGEFVLSRAVTVAGNASVEAGTLSLSGNAVSELFGNGDERTVSPVADFYVTHLGLPEPVGGVFADAVRVSVVENQTPVMQVRFSPKSAGIAMNGWRYLRLPFPMVMGAGHSYTVTTTSGQQGQVLVAQYAAQQRVNGSLSLAANSRLALSASVVKLNGLEGSGTVEAVSPSEIDLTLESGTELTFSGNTLGPVSLVKRSVGTFNLAGTGVFADGLTCRNGLIRAATASTVDPGALIVFGDSTGANECGRFSIAADGATFVNPIGITEMTTTGLTAQGVYAEDGNVLTITGTEVEDIEKDLRVTDWKAGQFALHAHAAAQGADPQIVFTNNEVAYLDFAARVDGIVGEAESRPGNKIVVGDVSTPSKFRKFTVQNNAVGSLGGTVEFTGALPIVADYFDVVGAQNRVVQGSGTVVRVDTELRFTDSTPNWEPINASDVDWTIGQDAFLCAPGFPSYLPNNGDASHSANSVLRFAGGTFKMRKGAAEPVDLFRVGSAMSVVAEAAGGTVDVIPENGDAACPVTIGSPISGDGSMTFKGDATLPEVTLAANASYAGSTTADGVTLKLAAKLPDGGDVALVNGAVLRNASAGTVTLRTLSTSGNGIVVDNGQVVHAARIVDAGAGVVKSGDGLLELDLEENAVSVGKVVVQDGTFGISVGTVETPTTLVADGNFEPATGITDDSNKDRRCNRDSAYFSSNLTNWTFASAQGDGSGICCNGGYFSNNGQITFNGDGNQHAAFLRNASGVGPGTISRAIVTEADDTEVTVEFQFAARWYNDSQWGRPNWYAKVGVVFDGETKYESESVRSSTTTDPDTGHEEYRTWHTCSVTFNVPKAGTHTLSFVALVPTYDDAEQEGEALLDNVKVGMSHAAVEDQKSLLENVSIDVASGAKLQLGEGLNAKIKRLTYDGVRITGRVSAASHPEFVIGEGSVNVGGGLLIFLR